MKMNRKYLITGASGGIGSAIAQTIANNIKHEGGGQSYSITTIIQLP